MKNFKKIISFTAALLFVVVLSPSVVKADSYNYSSWGEPIPSAKAMSHKLTVNQSSLGVNLYEPKDVYVHDDFIYIIDGRTYDENTKDLLHGKIIKLDKNFNLVEEFPSDKEGDEFYYKDLDPKLLMRNPQGIYVNDDFILVADTENSRLLKLSHDFEYIEEFGTPDDVSFRDFTYSPLKVIVDQAQRIYVIANGIYEGIVELNSDGSFNRYTGVKRVAVDPLQIIWDRFISDEQRAKRQLYLPTEFTNFSVDGFGFIYATSKVDKNNSTEGIIQRINPKGVDVLNRNGYNPPIGEVVYLPEAAAVKGQKGPSQLVDIAVNEYGVYTALDQKRGRFFTYDREGNLLYITGGIGNQEGLFDQPVALSYYGDNILIVDQLAKSLTVYEPTEFGKLVNEATRLYNKGDFIAAADTWREIVKLNTNYEIAYIGIGKALYREEQYKEAMDNFKLGNDKTNYSKAFQEYRNEIIRDNFGIMMTVIVIGIVYSFYRSIKTNIQIQNEDNKEG